MALFVSILLSFLFAFIYAAIIYWTDRYEKEPKLLLFGAFLWGAVVAAGISYVMNTVFGIGIYMLTADELVADIATGSFSAPFFEETTKSLAVLLIFFVFSKEFDSVLDGIVYAGITALGFAATENVLYLYERGFMEDGWGGLWFLFFLRIILGGFNHPLYTAFTGIGLAVARLNKHTLVKIVAPLLGWLAAMFVHFLHNTIGAFVQDIGGLVFLFIVDWLGWLFMGIIIFWAIRRERKWIQTQLREEVENGVISQKQYQVAYSPWKRGMAAFNGFGGGRYRDTRKFYKLCVELAYKKHQFERLGEKRSNPAELIEQYRVELAQLAPTAAS